MGPAVVVRVRRAARGAAEDQLVIRAIHGGSPSDVAQVMLQALDDSAAVFVLPDRAADLAAVVDLLARATPDEHRAVAAAIRAAAQTAQETGQ